MRKRSAYAVNSMVLVALTLLSCVVSLSADAKPKFTSFDFPGAINTQATGITPSGDIVGRYTSPDGVQHGFLLRVGGFRSIDFPGASSTDVTWINPRGQIVGDYFASDGKQHGFLLSGGKFTTIDYPNAQFTAAFGIGATGDIIGIRGDIAPDFHGFLLRGGRFSSIDFPGASGTLPAMISAGRIVGGYFNSTGLHGFSLIQGVFQTLIALGPRLPFSAASIRKVIWSAGMARWMAIAMALS